MPRRLFALALVVALAGALALPGGSATAKPKTDHASVTDKAGDAPVGIDLLSGTYSISNKKAIWSVRLKKLTETTFLAFESWPLNSAWDRITVFRENGKTVGRVYIVNNEEAPTPYLIKCRKLKVTWKPSKAKVRIVVPRSCMQASLPATAPTSSTSSRGSAARAAPRATPWRPRSSTSDRPLRHAPGARPVTPGRLH